MTNNDPFRIEDSEIFVGKIYFATMLKQMIFVTSSTIPVSPI